MPSTLAPTAHHATSGGECTSIRSPSACSRSRPTAALSSTTLAPSATAPSRDASRSRRRSAPRSIAVRASALARTWRPSAPGNHARLIVDGCARSGTTTCHQCRSAPSARSAPWWAAHQDSSAPRGSPGSTCSSGGSTTMSTSGSSAASRAKNGSGGAPAVERTRGGCFGPPDEPVAEVTGGSAQADAPTRDPAPRRTTGRSAVRPTGRRSSRR